MKRTLLPCSIAAIAAVLLFADCNKEQPTKALVHVRYKNGTVAPGATVKLYAHVAHIDSLHSTPNRLDMTMTSDGSGDALFDYSDFYKQGQAGFAVLDIDAKKDTLEGQNIIKIVEQTTSEETVVLGSTQ